jgi:dTDP-4-amino-4,6-dideoxygalactose transaminase
MYVNWLNRKTPDFNRVQKLLDESATKNHYTNRGPLSRRLEDFLREKLEIDDSKCVRATANGTAALHALVEGIRIYHEKSFRAATHSWTFPSAVIGPLKGTQIVDLTPEFDINLDQIDLDEVGIVIITNPFGYLMDIQAHEKWAKENDKIIIYDNAASPFSSSLHVSPHGTNSLNFGDASFISLHQTKSLGFGEGGLLIADKKYEEAIDRAMNFGFGQERIWNPYSSNYRMSDVSAAFIYDFIERNMQRILEHSLKLEEVFDKVCEHNGWNKMPNNTTDFCLHNSLVFFTKEKVKNLDLFEWKKYYKPLDPTPVALDFFNDVICLPSHLEVSTQDLRLLMK